MSLYVAVPAISISSPDPVRSSISSVTGLVHDAPGWTGPSGKTRLPPRISSRSIESIFSAGGESLTWPRSLIQTL